MITYLDLHITLIEVQTDLKCLLMVTFTVRVYKFIRSLMEIIHTYLILNLKYSNWLLDFDYYIKAFDALQFHKIIQVFL